MYPMALRVLRMDYPDLDSMPIKKQAALIESEFNLECTEDSLIDYYQIAIDEEDLRIQRRILGM